MRLTFVFLLPEEAILLQVIVSVKYDAMDEVQISVNDPFNSTFSVRINNLLVSAHSSTVLLLVVVIVLILFVSFVGFVV